MPFRCQCRNDKKTIHTEHTQNNARCDELTTIWLGLDSAWACSKLIPQVVFAVLTGTPMQFGADLRVLKCVPGYTQLENTILRKCDLKWCDQKISVLCFQQKYVEGIDANILTQIWVSSNDSTSSYREKCEKYTTNRNHTLSCHHRFYYSKIFTFTLSQNLFWNPIDLSTDFPQM